MVSKLAVIAVVSVAAVGLGIGGAVAALDDGSESPTTPPNGKVEVIDPGEPGHNEPPGEINQAGVNEPDGQNNPDGTLEADAQNNQVGADQPNGQNG